MQLLVGLGNPGAQYARTRHNAGFWLLDALAERNRLAFKSERRLHAEIASLELAGQSVVLMKPLTFMNESGTAVAGFANYFRIPASEVLIAHDELDLAPGVLRLKKGGGHGGHNGLRDITAKFGADFARVRIGIGHPGSAAQVVGYVLSAPSPDDRTVIEQAIDKALDAMPDILGSKFDHVMNTLNRRA